MNPVEALIFFSLLLSNCLSWKICCDDHSCLSKNVCHQQSTVAVIVAIIIISYLNNDYGNAGTTPSKRWIYILPSNFVTIWIWSIRQLVRKPRSN